MTESGASEPNRSVTVRFLDAAEADLGRLDRSVALRVAARLRWLADHAGEVRHLALAGDLKGLCKLRLGDWRVLYELLEEESTILVYAIGNRRDIYEQAKRRR